MDILVPFLKVTAIALSGRQNMFHVIRLVTMRNPDRGAIHPIYTRRLLVITYHLMILMCGEKKPNEPSKCDGTVDGSEISTTWDAVRTL